MYYSRIKKMKHEQRKLKYLVNVKHYTLCKNKTQLDNMHV